MEISERKPMAAPAASSSNWPHLFYAGRYEDIANAWQSRLYHIENASDFCFLVGALSFLGKVLDAEAVFKKYSPEFSLEALVSARYFLAVTYTRHLEADKAKALLLTNLKLRFRQENKLVNIYLRLGLMFYRYSYGRLIPALMHAERAYILAVADGFAYEAFIAADTLGHTQINVGKVQQGFSTLEVAKEMATRLGRGAIAQAADLTPVLYKSTFGLSGTPVKDLLEVRRNIIFKDSYTAAQTGLELSRNYLLNGQPQLAESLLTEIRKDAFGCGNVRLQILYQLRYAEYLYLLGEADEALVVVRDSLQRLKGNQVNPELRLELSLRGFSFKVKPKDSDISLLKRLTLRTGDQRSRRILARQLAVPVSYAPLKSEDVIGDLIDGTLRKSQVAINQSILSQRLGLLSGAAGVKPGEKAIVFGINGVSCTVFSRGSVTHIADGLTDMQRSMLEFLYCSEKTAEEVVEHVWQEKYNALRHEGLLNSFCSRLRAALPLLDPVIERRNGRFGLSAEVRLEHFRKSGVSSPIKRPLQASYPVESDLNFRQREFIAKASDQFRVSGFSVMDYRNHFNVSASSALRDLRGLIDKQRLTSTGQGRATHYYFT